MTSRMVDQAWRTRGQNRRMVWWRERSSRNYFSLPTRARRKGVPNSAEPIELPARSPNGSLSHRIAWPPTMICLANPSWIELYIAGSISLHEFVSPISPLNSHIRSRPLRLNFQRNIHFKYILITYPFRFRLSRCPASLALLLCYLLSVLLW